MDGTRLIAILDYDSFSLMVLTQIFVTHGMVAACFSSPGEFIEFMKSHSPDCVLLDMNMPGMSGVEVQDKLREMTSRVPIIFGSGYNDLATADAAITHGAFHFVT